MSDRRRSDVWLERFQRFVRFPASSLILFTVVSFAVGENYPFSDFPMYSEPSKRTMLLYLADGDGQPVPIKAYTGVSAARLNKLYGARLDRLGEEKGIRPYRLGAEDRATAGHETLAFLREAAGKRGKRGEGLPDRLSIVRVDLEFVDTGGPPRRQETVVVVED